MSIFTRATTTTLPRVHGNNVTAQINGVTQAQCQKIWIKPSIKSFESDVLEAEFDQKTTGKRTATGQLVYEVGNSKLPSVMPVPGDEITGLNFTLAAGSILPPGLDDVTKYGKCRVMSNAYELQRGINTFAQDIEWGFID